MIDERGGVLKAGENVCFLEKFVVRENFGMRGIAGQHIEHVLDPQAVAANAGPAAAFGGIECDPVHLVHGKKIARCRARSEQAGASVSLWPFMWGSG